MLLSARFRMASATDAALDVTADVGIHGKYPFELEVRRRLADTLHPPAAAQRSRPRLSALASTGEARAQALTARTAGYPALLKASPTRWVSRRQKFTAARATRSSGDYGQRGLSDRGCNRPGRLWRVDPWCAAE